MKQLLPVFLTFLMTVSFGQEKFMSLCFISAIPLGDFAANENLRSNGFAYTGYGGEYTGVYFLTEYIGFGGNIKFISNTVDNNTAQRLLREEIPDDIPDDIAEFGIGLWKQVSFAAGPYFSLPLSRISLDAYTLIGLNFVMPPAMEVSATIDEDSYYRRLSVQTVSYVLDLGIALRYHMNDNYSIRFFSGYSQSKSKGKISEELDLEGPDNSDVVETDQSITIQTVNLGIGIVYRL